VKGGLDIYKNQNAVGSSNMTIFNLRPQITFSQPKWRLKAAINMYATSDSSYGFNPEDTGDVKVAPTPESTSRIGRAFDRVRSLWQRGELWLGLGDYNEVSGD
jgi:hypothetical protein